MTIAETTTAAQASLAAALRQVLNQLLRLLEESDPETLLHNGGNMVSALSTWRRAVEAQTSTLSVQKSRALEDAKLLAMAKAARLEKDNIDLRERNSELLAEIVRLNKRVEGLKQQVLELQFARDGTKAEAKRLDLEVRDLHRHIRELEGGPPLTPAEAAPRSGQEVAEDPREQEKQAEAEEAGEIAARVGMSNARSAVEQAFSAMWKPKEEDAKPQEAEPPAKAAKKPAAKKPVQKKTAKKPAQKTEKTPKKPAQKTKKTPAAKKPAPKKTAKKPAPKKPAPRKTAKKPAPKKPAPKKTPQKPAAKKPTKTAKKKAASKKG